MELWIGAGCFLLAMVALATPAGLAVAGKVAAAGRCACASPARIMALLGVVSFAIYATPSLWHVPAPVVHDEFAYLLQAQTFAQGRLTNPPVELPQFFETFHVIQSPTYAAKFPPGPALAMVVGVWAGLPILGVWLGLSAAIMAIFWMLRAILPMRWAALAALLLAVHPTIVWFSQTYWGGGVAMLGGALLGGGVPRFCRGRATTGSCLLAGIGIGILAITRPFEGMLFTLACGVAVAIAGWQRRHAPIPWMRWLAAAAVAPQLSLGFLGYYDARVTGKPLTMPYALHTARYMAAPLFFWDAMPPTPVYPNEQMRAFHTGVELDEYHEQADHYIASRLQRGGFILWGYLRPMLLAVPLAVAIGLILRRRSGSGLLLACGLIAVGVLLCHLASCPWMRLAYMAPLAGMLFVLIGAGLRQINSWKLSGQPLGAIFVRALVITQFCIGIYALQQIASRNARAEIAQRDAILKTLQSRGGQQLVFVRYAAGHFPGEEWIYNPPSLSAAKVLFARDLGDEENQRLLRHYRRTPWLLQVGDGQPRLTPMNAVVTAGE
jgi:hypothetical protein